MAIIDINEISQTLSYNIEDSSYCCVALPITSCWGPGYFEPANAGDKSLVLEDTTWERFRANSSGLELFTSTYRGAAANYRSAKDYSYQMALTLLSRGYDVLVCRLCPGAKANSKVFTCVDSTGATLGTLTLKAKYPGTFGNNIVCTLSQVVNSKRWKFIVYTVDASGTRSAVENLSFVFDVDDSSDSIPYIKEVKSAYVDFILSGELSDEVGTRFTYQYTDSTGTTTTVYLDDKTQGDKGNIFLTGGTDRADLSTDTPSTLMQSAKALAMSRYAIVEPDASRIENLDYIKAITNRTTSSNLPDLSTASKIRYNEWLFTAFTGTGNDDGVVDLLKDRLAYNNNRIISGGWDDQNITEINGDDVLIPRFVTISPIHKKLMEVAYLSRCATAFLDIPKSLARSGVYNESTDEPGYAQLLSRDEPGFDTDGLYSTHSALFAPWGTYKYVSTTKQNIAAPSFLKLLIDRSMILNQTIQKEWLLPDSRTNNVQIGAFDYTVPNKILNLWQPATDVDGGVAVNAICNIPGLGTGVWGNSTLFENEPATYQALKNLSTRLLVNALKDVVFKAGVSITFNYNTGRAYEKFYVAVKPLLDLMVNVGALDNNVPKPYKIEMGEGIDAEGMIMANTCVGKIWIVPTGSIDNITIDLIAMPPGTDLTNAE